MNKKMTILLFSFLNLTTFSFSSMAQAPEDLSPRETQWQCRARGMNPISDQVSTQSGDPDDSEDVARTSAFNACQAASLIGCQIVRCDQVTN